MDETSFRVLDILSRQIGNAISINELRKKIERTYGRAHYANVHAKILLFTREQITRIETTGKASIPTLNFANWSTIDFLTETEIWKKTTILGKHVALQKLLTDICTDFSELNFVRSMSIIDAEHNLKLNIAEFLILLNTTKYDSDGEEDDIILGSIIATHEKLRVLQGMHDIRINDLVLTTEEFIMLLKSTEANPVREMLSEGINFLCPQFFWTEIQIASENEGLRIKFEENKTNPAEISDKDLIHNLGRFGYKEFGPELAWGRDICIEYIVTSVLLSGNVRRIEGIPFILAKNKVIYNLLIFLGQKYDCTGKLLGSLKILEKHKPTNQLKDAISILESMGTKEISTSKRSVKAKLMSHSIVEK